MATEFKYLKFGLVPTTFDAATLESSERIIKSFLGSFNAFNLLDDAASHKEILPLPVAISDPTSVTG